ncbi:LWR-salt protein [Haloarcula sp. 1CSR25-25]|uniref:LWR-salt protein n=1 Tax=Haloarcula sp. 1CSR25-25 TaxID=2862545 RepID=UPI00289501A3|nr:LWR-salt protein [Haloarcula sp. 1CSR25-25]MDT3436295.1 LWR-salt protein [Haloarcula sp. 1CSR25-25]
MDTTGELASLRPTDPDGATARYVFRVEIRLEPDAAGLWTDPDRVETTLYRAADDPGTSGWLFFRDTLWRGELADEPHFRRLVEDELGCPVVAASFSELRTDEAYFDSLKAEIAGDLPLFNADSVSEVLTKYLGSSVRVE